METAVGLLSCIILSLAAFYFSPFDLYIQEEDE